MEAAEFGSTGEVIGATATAGARVAGVGLKVILLNVGGAGAATMTPLVEVEGIPVEATTY